MSIANDKVCRARSSSTGDDEVTMQVMGVREDENVDGDPCLAVAVEDYAADIKYNVRFIFTTEDVVQHVGTASFSGHQSAELATRATAMAVAYIQDSDCFSLEVCLPDGTPESELDLGELEGIQAMGESEYSIGGGKQRHLYAGTESGSVCGDGPELIHGREPLGEEPDIESIADLCSSCKEQYTQSD